MKTHRSGFVAVAAIAMSAVGCSSNDRADEPVLGSSPSPTTSPSATDSSSPSTPPSADEPEQLAVAAYLSMWEDYAVAAETSDWRAARLANNATGEALSVMSRGLYASNYNGEVSKGRPVLDPEVTEVDPPDSPTTVVISDCGDSSGWLKYDAETGELVEDEPEGRRAITAWVELQPDGTWKVSSFAVQAVGSC